MCIMGGGVQKSGFCRGELDYPTPIISFWIYDKREHYKVKIMRKTVIFFFVLLLRYLKMENVNATI